MQAPDTGRRAAYRLEQTLHVRHPLQPRHQLRSGQHLVEQLGIHPVKQAHIEQKFAVFVGKVVPQPRHHPVVHHLPRGPGLCPSPPRPCVAVDAECDRPAGRLCRHRLQLPPRQLPAEEPRDLLSREPQILDRENLRIAPEHRLREIQSRRQLPTRHHQVQSTWPATHEPVDQRHRLRARHSLQFVQREHARFAVPVKGAQQKLDPLVGRQSPLCGGRRIDDVQAGALEGESQVCVQHRGLVLRVQRQPGGRYAALAQDAATLGHQHRLAESTRRHQYRDPAIGRHATLVQRNSAQVASHSTGDGDPMLRQPPRDACLQPGRPVVDGFRWPCRIPPPPGLLTGPASSLCMFPVSASAGARSDHYTIVTRACPALLQRRHCKLRLPRTLHHTLRSCKSVGRSDFFRTQSAVLAGPPTPRYLDYTKCYYPLGWRCPCGTGKTLSVGHSSPHLYAISAKLRSADCDNSDRTLP